MCQSVHKHDNTLYVVHLDGVSCQFFSIRENLGPFYNDSINGIFGSYSKNEIIV